MKKLLLLTVLLSICGSSFAIILPPVNPVPLMPNAQFDMFMVDSTSHVAHWLDDRIINGMPVANYTVEPLDVEFKVKSTDPKSAMLRLNQFLLSHAINFGHLSSLHSDNYKIIYHGKTIHQYKNRTYSDNNVNKQNDHLRIFGPIVDGDEYDIYGSCSEESSPDVYHIEGTLKQHHFVSFKHCIYQLATNSLGYAKVNLDHEFHNGHHDTSYSTRDYNGIGLLIELN